MSDLEGHELPQASMEAGASARPSRWKPFAFVAGVFLLGAVAGGGAARAYTVKELTPKAGASYAEQRLEMMRRHLHLNDDQVAAIQKIYEETQGERDKAQEPCREQIDSSREAIDKRVRDVLNADQRAKYEEYRARRRSNRAK
jgi:Spy/CpxP family protein refolding chaperone